MIQSLADRWMTARPAVEAKLREGHPSDYRSVVRLVVETVTSDKEYGDDNLDPDRIHEIDEGDYRGTHVYVIAEKGYQPSDYWYVKVSYGSCSGCDTLQSISGYGDAPPNVEQVEGYWTLGLHLVQGLKKMGDTV